MNSYRWSTGETTDSITVASAISLTLEVSNACGTATDDLEIVNSGDSPIMDLGPDLTLCPNELPVTLATNLEGEQLWSTGNTVAALEVNQAGIFSVEFTNGCGTASDEVDVTVLEDEIVSQSFSFCAGDSVTYAGETFYKSGDYSWLEENAASTGCDMIYEVEITELTNPVLEESYQIPFGESIEVYGKVLDETGVFSFEILGENGCEQLIEVTITEGERPMLDAYVPNSFTPDGDGINEVFKPVIVGLDVSPLQFYEFFIYNRWGQVVHSNYDYNDAGWIGRAVNSGEFFSANDVYNWVITYQKEFSQERRQLKGFVTIVK